MLETIQPLNETHWLELRAQDLTSTESPALFGISPYNTPFEVFHRKAKKLVVGIDENERMKWGKRLQDAIAAGIAEDNGWQVRRMDEYLRIPSLRMGSSYDFAIGDDGLLEVKNVDSLAFKNGWVVEDGVVEAPPHIELQVQHQLAVSGRKYVVIGALVGGNKIVQLHREPVPEIIDALKERVSTFWKNVDAGIAPEPDFNKDSDVIARLFSVEPGKIFDARGNEAFVEITLEYKKAQELEKQAQSAKDAAKSKLIMAYGEAEKVIGDNFSITAGMVAGADISFTRKPYRNFRINWKKEKAG